MRRSEIQETHDRAAAIPPAEVVWTSGQDALCMLFSGGVPGMSLSEETQRSW